jgi:hypothetical protein
LSGDYCLPAVEEDLAAIVFRTHGEMNPIGGAALLEDQFVKVTMGTIRDVESLGQKASTARNLMTEFLV